MLRRCGRLRAVGGSVILSQLWDEETDASMRERRDAWWIEEMEPRITARTKGSHWNAKRDRRRDQSVLESEKCGRATTRGGSVAAMHQCMPAEEEDKSTIATIFTQITKS